MQGLSLGRIDLDEPRGGKIEILGQILGADAKEIRETAWRGRSECFQGFEPRKDSGFATGPARADRCLRTISRAPAAVVGTTL